MSESEMKPNPSTYRRAFAYLRSQPGSVETVKTSPRPIQQQLLFFPTYAVRNVARDQSAETVVDVHGWIFSPSAATTRKNRYTVLLARSIAGISTESSNNNPLVQEEGSRSSATEEVAATSVAGNTNLATRIAPFLAKPFAERIIKIELVARIEDQETSLVTRSFETSPAGHFRDLKLFLRAQDKHVTGQCDIHPITTEGISCISDIDDTIKHTAVASGMREAFRNAFVRDLHGLQVQGVSEWYHAMKEMGVKTHYVSNSPYQLWPCLKEFLQLSKLPEGSVHLKAYSGVLSGIFEPAADKKRKNVESVLRDFPLRKFLLVGDSGEQDLELYCELSQVYQDQILGVFIRDVSTPVDLLASDVGFFNSKRVNTEPEMASGTNTVYPSTHDSLAAQKRSMTEPNLPAQPLADLVDLKDETVLPPNAPTLTSSTYLDDLAIVDQGLSKGTSTISSSRPQKPPKPTNLTRIGAASTSMSNTTLSTSSSSNMTAPSRASTVSSLTSTSTTSTTSTNTTTNNDSTGRKPKLPPRPLAISMPSLASLTSLSSLSNALPSPKTALSINLNRASISQFGENRRQKGIDLSIEIWQRRVEKARASLPAHVPLFIWRKGSDVSDVACELIKRASQQPK